MRIPQAIFTSLRSQKISGYQLAAKSAEIGDELARELTAWGPAHDSLLDETALEPSVNFHPLGRDHFCLSLTSSAGAEYSSRAGARVYTQMFVLPREALARFDNNPFLILRAIDAAGRAAAYEQLPQRLRSLPLIGRAGPTDQGCPQRWSEEHAPESLSKLATAVLENSSVGLATSLPPRSIFAALFQSIPPDERPQVSFTTGLRHSPRRPFRLFVLPSDPIACRKFHHQPEITVVELSRRPLSKPS